MKKAVRITLGGLVALLVVAQFVPLHRDNPPVHSDLQAPVAVHTALRAGCYDCHSNETHWPWWSHIAPASFLIVSDVHEGRSHLNFSTWGSLPPEKRAKLLRESWHEIEEREMPPSLYLTTHPGGRLTPESKAQVLDWMRSQAPVGAGEPEAKSDNRGDENAD